MKKGFKIIIFSVFTFWLNYLNAQNFIIKVKKSKSQGYIYINLKGEQVINDEFYHCTNFSEYGCAVISYTEHGSYKIIDKNGKFIKTEIEINPLYNQWTGKLYDYNNGLLRIYLKGKYGAVNHKGELVIQNIYKELSDFKCNYARGKIGKNYFIISKDGKSTSIKLDNIKEIKDFSEGYAVIRQGGQFGYIDTLGNLVIEPIYDGLGHFNDGIAWARNMSEKIGYLNKEGNWVIEPKFLEGKNYDGQSDLARVKTFFGWGYVNSKNEFNNFNIVGSFYSYYEGLAIKREKDKLGYIDNTGEWVIQPKYDVAHKFVNGFAKVEINKKWGLIDKKGNWILKPEYKEIHEVILLK